MPRGQRDEEFHTAVCELLSDWGSTVAAPVVESLRIVSPTNDGVTLAVRDYLDRIGVPAPRAPPRQRRRPRGPGAARTETPTAYPVVERWDGDPVRGHARCATSRCQHLRPPRPDRRRQRRRPGHRRRRAGRPRRVGVRRVRGPHHGRHRGRGDRRPGRHQLDDPQLPRLPARHLRDAAGPAGAQPGDPLRHPVLHRLAGDRARGRPRRRTPRRPHRGRRRAGARRRDRLRRHLPQARRRRRSTGWSAAASTTAPR